MVSAGIILSVMFAITITIVLWIFWWAAREDGRGQKDGSDIEIQPREVLALGRRLEQIIAEHTGQPLAKSHR